MDEKIDGKQPSKKILEILQSNPDKGLDSNTAEKRFQESGPNMLSEEKESLLKKWLSYFWGPIPWMIEIAAILSAFLQRWPDFIFITSLLVINALLGFFHEYKAGNAIEALKKKLALQSKVLRDGKWIEIEASKLVVGDIIAIKAGNVIPADVKLLQGEYLSVDQSALTGESLPVDKKVEDIAFSGTVIKKGEMKAVVIATGMHTFFGKTASLVQGAKKRSHLQEAVVNIGRFLIIFTLVTASVLFIFSLFREFKDHIHIQLSKNAIFFLVLIVAGIPVALPAVLSVTMAIGAKKMADLKAILSKLIAIEELAGMNILCSDKTGTLTKNELSVRDIKPHEGFSEKECLTYFCMASEENSDDAIDQAVLEKKKDFQDIASFTVSKFIPFDPVSKKTEATVKTSDGKTFVVAKGAPQVICDLAKPDDLNQVKQLIDDYAGKGLRTLAAARRTNGSWEFVGLIALFDPPREDTAATLNAVKNLGVNVKMVTGDHKAIAKEMAGQLQLGNNITTLDEIKNVSGDQKEQAFEKADGFAEVFPEHKFTIVKTLQSKKGNIIGMTGDGVNDAPALKQADIGIAVSKATDAARAAADLVLTQPGLSVIKTAIEEARKIFGRMKSYAIYRVTETCRLLLFLLLAMVIFHTPPLSAIMIILIALLNDIPIMMIAYDHMEASSKPDLWNLKEVFSVAIILSIIGVISTFGLYWIGLEIWRLDKDSCATLAFFGILCGGNLTIYLTRNQKLPLSSPLPEKKFFLGTLFSQITGTL
jgi:H+-transporting ATPase